MLTSTSIWLSNHGHDQYRRRVFLSPIWLSNHDGHHQYRRRECSFIILIVVLVVIFVVIIVVVLTSLVTLVVILVAVIVVIVVLVVVVVKVLVKMLDIVRVIVLIFSLWIYKLFRYLFFVLNHSRSWKASHKKKASDKMCSICILKRQGTCLTVIHVLLRKRRRNRPHKNKAKDICLVFVWAISAPFTQYYMQTKRGKCHCLLNVQIVQTVSLACFLCEVFQL